jgi:hypothetical protein
LILRLKSDGERVGWRECSTAWATEKNIRVQKELLTNVRSGFSKFYQGQFTDSDLGVKVPNMWFERNVILHLKFRDKLEDTFECWE